MSSTWTSTRSGILLFDWTSQGYVYVVVSRVVALRPSLATPRSHFSRRAGRSRSWNRQSRRETSRCETSRCGHRGRGHRERRHHERRHHDAQTSRRADSRRADITTRRHHGARDITPRNITVARDITTRRHHGHARHHDAQTSRRADITTRDTRRDHDAQISVWARRPRSFSLSHRTFALDRVLGRHRCRTGSSLMSAERAASRTRRQTIRTPIRFANRYRA